MPDLNQLKRAVEIAEQIARLESELARLLGNGSAATQPSKIARSASSGGTRRTLSPEAREKIAAAQRKRWAKAKGKTTSSTADSKATKAAKSKGGITPEGRARLAAAMKARWAARKKGASAPNAKK